MAIQYSGYNTNVDRTWGIRNTNTLRYGFEIETGWRTESAMQEFFNDMEAKHLDSYVMAKEDGSISASYDAEIVSRPLVIQEAKRVAKRVIDTYGEQPASRKTLDGCGVHVHTTRNFWSKAAAILARRSIMGVRTDYYREAQYPNIIRPWTDAFWNALAARMPNNYCRRDCGLESWRMGEESYSSYRTVAQMYRNWKERDGHFDAMSWSHRGPTLEFRLWGSSTKARTIASYLDCVDALMRYSEHIAEALCITDITQVRLLPEFNPKAFAAWVFKQNGYQALKYRLKNAPKIVNALESCPDIAEPALRVITETPQPEPAQTPVAETARHLHPGEDLCPLLRGSVRVCTCTCEECRAWNLQDDGMHAQALQNNRTPCDYALCPLNNADILGPCTCPCTSCIRMNASPRGFHAERLAESQRVAYCQDGHHNECVECRAECAEPHNLRIGGV